MRKKILIFAFLLILASTAAMAVSILTTCGKWTYGISRDEFNETGGGGDPLTYNEYLMIINEAQCGVKALPRVFEEVEL